MLGVAVACISAFAGTAAASPAVIHPQPNVTYSCTLTSNTQKSGAGVPYEQSYVSCSAAVSAISVTSTVNHCTSSACSSVYYDYTRTSNSCSGVSTCAAPFAVASDSAPGQYWNGFADISITIPSGTGLSTSPVSCTYHGQGQPYTCTIYGSTVLT